jgi:hypothetical protein
MHFDPGMNHGSTRAGRRRRAVRGSTLLRLVLEVGQTARSEAELVRTVRRLVNSGEVVLTGNFAGRRF